MPSRPETLAGVFIALATVLYVVAAWMVKPGFYDCCAAPQYDYVSPPALLAGGNIQPTSGTGTLAIGADGRVDGGLVATNDQPQPQAKLFIAPGNLVPPAGGGPVQIDIKPFAPAQTSGVTVDGNVYCATANTTFQSGQAAMIALSVPPYGPFATTIYYSHSHAGPWSAMGGTFDLNNYQTTAAMGAFGCFAVGYATATPPGQPRLGGQLLPIVTAAVIVIVLVAGIPLAVRRRLRR